MSKLTLLFNRTLVLRERQEGATRAQLWINAALVLLIGIALGGFALKRANLAWQWTF